MFDLIGYSNVLNIGHSDIVCYAQRILELTDPKR
jgi:hypothetical protein